MSSVASPVPGLDFGRSVKWMFNSTKWTTNFLWVFICMLLGTVFIGSFVMLGYQIDIVQRRSRGGENDPVDFDPDRFSDYLSRGLIPMVVYIVLAFGAGAIMFAGLLIWSTLMSVLIGGEKPEGATALLVVGPIFLLMFVMMCAFIFIAVPLAVRAGLSNNLSEGFKFNWAISTAKMMWPHGLLFLLYSMVCGFLSYFGLLACFVGIFFTAAWLQLVIPDLGAQLYDIYLYKGGEPIPMHGESQPT